jgi:hypothetical protein
MAQTQSGRIERLERTLRRLGHKLEKRGRGYQIKDGAGDIVSGEAAIALEAAEKWIAVFVKPPKPGA